MSYESLPDWFIEVFENLNDLDKNKLKLWINTTPRETRKRIIKAAQLIYLSRNLSKLKETTTESENNNDIDLATLKLSLLVIAVECLGAPPEYLDFYQWFISNKFESSETMRISKNEFISAYDEYKSHYGSLRNFKRFIDTYLKNENLKSSDELELIRIRRQKSKQANEEIGYLTFDQTITKIYNLRSDYFHKGKDFRKGQYDFSKIEKYGKNGAKITTYKTGVVNWFESIVIDSLYNFWKEKMEEILNSN